MKHTCFAVLPVFLAIACSNPAPTAPGSVPSATLTGPLASAQASGATSTRQEFQANVNIPVPSPCLGGIFLITGQISGWAQTVITPSGHAQSNEHLDFSQLTASHGGNLWAAAPGSTEIWSVNLPPPGDAARVVVHEGRTRFVSSTGAPNVLFVHRIHRVWLPTGELHINEVTFDADCYGKIS